MQRKKPRKTKGHLYFSQSQSEEKMATLFYSLVLNLNTTAHSLEIAICLLSQNLLMERKVLRKSRKKVRKGKMLMGMKTKRQRQMKRMMGRLERLHQREENVETLLVSNQMITLKQAVKTIKKTNQMKMHLKKVENNQKRQKG